MTVSEGGPRKADHGPYIEAVRRGMLARDIAVKSTFVGAWPDGRREATLLLRPDDSAFAERLPGEVSASWDEDSGWSMSVCRDSFVSRVGKGLGVLPTPDDVAIWAVTLLTHPELTPSYEDGPFRDHEKPDPGFEEQLARYGPAD
jgi:hypothetical protein